MVEKKPKPGKGVQTWKRQESAYPTVQRKYALPNLPSSPAGAPNNGSFAFLSILCLCYDADQLDTY